MADIKLTDLPVATTASPTAVGMIVDSNVSEQITVPNMVKAGLPSLAGNDGKVLSTTAGNLEWVDVGGTGTVTSVGVSGGTTGLTVTGSPVTAAGTMTLAGTLGLANGGTGAVDAAGARTALGVPSTGGTGANGTWGISITGTAQKATNIVGGVANQIPVQSAVGTTSFIPAATVDKSVLSSVGGVPTWASSANRADGLTGGAANQIVYQSNAGVTAFVDEPVGADQYLHFDGSNFGWVAIPEPSSLVGTTNPASSCTTALGVGSGTATTGQKNTFLGFGAGAVNTGNENTFIGAGAGDQATTSSYTVAIGTDALGGAASATSGSVAIGHGALKVLQNGVNNVAVGYLAGDAATSALSCTFVGANAGGAVTTGNSNTFVGNSAGSNVTTGAGNTVLGAYSGSATMSGQVYIADGTGKARIHVNEYGGIEYFGNTGTTGFGTFGQYLRSNSSTGCPAWEWPNTYGAQSTTTSGAIGITDEVTLIDCSINGNLTITLPTLDAGTGGTNGRFIILKRLDNTANIATLQPAAGQLIDGQATDTLHALNAVTLMGWGTNWVVLNGYISTQPSLPAPELLNTMAGDTDVFVTFTPVEGATSYEVVVNEK